MTNGDTVNCYTDKQVRLIGKTIVKVQELSAELKLEKRKSALHAERVKQLLSTTDSLGKYIVEYREVVYSKDSVITLYREAVSVQSNDINMLENKVKAVRRKGIVRTVTTALTGVAVGLFTGLMLGR